MATKKLSQKEQILRHLREHDTITPQEALREYGCMRLSARILELRKQGHVIATDQDNPKNYAKYELIEEA